MPSKWARMTWEQRLAWAEKEAWIRKTQPFDPVKEREREREVAATSIQAGQAIRRYWREKGK